MSDKILLPQLLTSPVEDYFDENTINKSQKYLLGTRLTDFHSVDDKLITANINGTKKYFTSISIFNDELSFKCTCSRGGICKHSAALYQYAQNKLNIKVITDEIKTITSEEMFANLKRTLNGRTYFSEYNFDIFYREIKSYINMIDKYLEKDNINDAMGLCVKILDVLSRYIQANYSFKQFAIFLNKHIEKYWTFIIDNFDLFIQKFNLITGMNRFDLFDYFLNQSVKSQDINIEKVYLFLKNEVDIWSKYLSTASKEKYYEKLFLYNISNQFKRHDYTNINEVKKRLYLIDYRILYLEYLSNNKYIDEAKQIYSKYNYSSSDNVNSVKRLYEIYIKIFSENNETVLCEKAICEYIKNIEFDENIIIELVDKYKDLSNEFINSIGLALFTSEKPQLITVLCRKYNELNLYNEALNAFTKFDSKFAEYKEQYTNELKKIYYKKVLSFIREDILLSTVTKKKIMKCVERLHELPNGDYYIYDLYEYFKEYRYRGVFYEFEDFASKLDL